MRTIDVVVPGAPPMRVQVNRVIRLTLNCNCWKHFAGNWQLDVAFSDEDGTAYVRKSDSKDAYTRVGTAGPVHVEIAAVFGV